MTVVAQVDGEPLPEKMWADGNRAEAFEEMYRRCYPALVNLCRRSLGGHGDPEALAQEAFVRAWVSLDRFTEARPFWPWVATIARRLCIDNRRRLHREQVTVQVDAEPEGGGPLPDEYVEADEEYRSARVALAQLKPSERRVITLRDIRGWSYDEIARFEGVTIESIRGSLKRARASLRKSYHKVASGAPAVVSVRSWRSLRVRSGGMAEVGHRAMAGGAMTVAGDAAVGLLAAALLLTMPPSVVTPPSEPQVAGVGMARHEGFPQPAAADTPSGVPTARSGDGRTRVEGAPVAAAGRDARAGLPLLPSDGATTPEGVAFNEVTPSPSYERDGTLFAAGTVAASCPYGPCAVLFRSTDRGATWQRLPALGFTGGHVLLPPRYPEDLRIFVSAMAGLLVSEDDGGTFTTVAPFGGPAAISPTFAHDHRVLLGQAPGWEYRADVEAMQPSGMVLPSSSLSAMPAFSPSYAADWTVFMGGTALDGHGRQQSAVFRCRQSLCEGPTRLAGGLGAPTLVVSPSFASDGVVVAWRGTSLHVSGDAGATFAVVPLPVDAYVQDATFDGRGRLLVAVRRLADDQSTGGLFRSSDLGRTWEPLGVDTRIASGVVSVAALPSDRIVAAVSAAARGGLLCSADDGATWSARCE